MNQDQIDTINTVQEVLRVMVAIMSAQPGVDLTKIAFLLQSAAADDKYSPIARRMLADLAEWPEALARAEKSSH